MIWIDRLGTVSGPLERPDVFAMIEAEHLGPSDRVSIDGGPWVRAGSAFGDAAWPRHPGHFGAVASLILAGGVVGYGLLVGPIVDRMIWHWALPLGLLALIAAGGALAIGGAPSARRYRSVYLLLVAGLGAIQIPLSVLQLRVELKEASLPASSWGERGSVVLFEGYIRADFASQLADALARAGEGAMLVVDSSGGNVAAAARAATVMKAHPGGLTLRIHAECASACALLLGGASRIEAEPEARIGLHNLAAFVSGFERFLPDQQSEYARDLEEAGFGVRALGAVQHTPPDRMTWLNVMVDGDTLPPMTIVDRSGKALARGPAAVRYLLHRIHDGGETATAEYIALVAQGLPLVVEKHARAALEALRRDDDAQYIAALGALGEDAAQKTLPLASEAVIRRWLTNDLVAMREAIAARDHGRCFRSRTMQEMLVVATDAASNGWQRPTPLDPLALNRLRESAVDAVAPPVMSREDWESQSPAFICHASAELLTRLLALPENELKGAVASIYSENS